MLNLLLPIGGIQARVQTMGLGKLCLIGLGVVEAEQSHPQVMPCDSNSRSLRRYAVRRPRFLSRTASHRLTDELYRHYFTVAR